jgi:hypothetical protein
LRDRPDSHGETNREIQNSDVPIYRRARNSIRFLKKSHDDNNASHNDHSITIVIGTRSFNPGFMRQKLPPEKDKRK